MPHAWARMLAVLTVALIVANAQCFVSCLAQPDDASAQCPQHSSSKSGKCVQQHDFTTSAAHGPVVAIAPVAVLGGEIANGLTDSRTELARCEPSPPFYEFGGTPLPIRI